MTQRKLLEESRSRSVKERSAQSLTTPHDIDESALVKRLEYRPGANASDLLDLRATNRLPVRDDGERLECRRRKTLGPRGQLGTLDGFGVLGPGKDLPAATDFYQLDAVTIHLVMLAQLFQC